MNNNLFSFDQSIKENVKKSGYPVGIHENNVIADAAYNDEYDCLDITYENPKNNYTFRDRIFNPTVNVPAWTTVEEALRKTQSKIKHIMRRFMSDEECTFNASSWKEMCDIAAEKLLEHSVDKEFDLKLIFDKNFAYPKIGLPPFIRVEGEPKLAYSKWEQTNALLPEETGEPTSAEGGDLF